MSSPNVIHMRGGQEDMLVGKVGCMSVSFPQICDVQVLNHELNFYHNVLISWLSFYVHFCKYDSLYSCSLTGIKEMRVTLVRQFMYGFLTCGIKQV